MAFVFYDTETTGTATAFDQILQFAAIHTDDELIELDQCEVRSRLDAHIVAHPGALLTNGITVEILTKADLPSHYEMVRAVRAKLLEWSPAVFVGYNSLKFDEKMLRSAFYQTLHPPYLTSVDGNCRADAMSLVQAASIFAPHCLSVPTDDKGKLTYKLDRIAPQNGFAHEHAHDALADVQATLHLARCVKAKAKDCWDRFVTFARKSNVATFIETSEGFVLTEFYYNRAYHYPVGFFAVDPEQSNVMLCLDLRNDQTWMKSLSEQDLGKALKRPPKPIRRVKINDCPLIAPFEAMPTSALHSMSIDELRKAARDLRQDEQFCTTLLKAWMDVPEVYEDSPHVEEQLYVDFIPRADLARMEAFHAADWPQRNAILGEISDARIQHFGQRLIYLHDPELLPPAVKAQLDELIASRLLDDDPPAEKWTSIPAALKATEEALVLARGTAAELLKTYREFLIERAYSLQGTR